MLRVEYELGLQDYLRSPVPLESIVLQLSDKLSFVPSGGIDHNSVELLYSANMREFLKTVRDAYDLVIFDAPPLYPIADARVMADLVDAVLLCVRAGSTPESIVSNAVEFVRPKVIGAVLTFAEGQSDRRYYYYGHNGKE
jgi:Mrp family chromosome partitioning ATPase